jgi:subtilisin family serine protease
LLERLLEVAARRGVVVVGADSGVSNTFPAADAHVIAVAAGPRDGSSALVAPGTRVLSTVPEGGWGYFSGASFAAAHVSGVAAVLLERVPGLTPATLREALGPPTGDPHATIDPCTALGRLTGEPACACCTSASASRLRTPVR